MLVGYCELFHGVLGTGNFFQERVMIVVAMLAGDDSTAGDGVVVGGLVGECESGVVLVHWLMTEH